VTIHILSDRRLPFSSCSGAANPAQRVRSMLEGSNRSRVTGIVANSARDLFEAGLNEAASVEHCLWALDQRDDGAIISSKPQSRSIASKMPMIERSNRRAAGDELLLLAEDD
jgi:hypothetical protein